ncbi:hypothetical protein [Bradyrhizobium sp. USDA 4486]
MTAVGDAGSLELMVNAIVDYAIFMLDTEGLPRCSVGGSRDTPVRLSYTVTIEAMGRTNKLGYLSFSRRRFHHLEPYRCDMLGVR